MASWQLEMGAQVLDGASTRFRVWAPVARTVEVELYPPAGGIVRHPMQQEGDGVWFSTVDAGAGTLYRYRLDEDWGYPDPYSRSQPEGVHGPSQVVDARSFRWSDGGWRGLDPQALVLYEVHVGTYTPAGTLDALIEQLDALRELGVSALELMPVCEFPGLRNWGYDAAHLFAPESGYGGPEALRRLVDAAHARGLGVVLDVVYNHRAPDGDYLPVYSPDYYTDRYQTPWGYAVNFDGPNSDRVRRYFVDNALYWLHEYHIDGLRLDATHQMHDSSPEHIVQELAESVHSGIPGRTFLMLAEDERNDLRLILPTDTGGRGLDALWIDDLHHSLYVAMRGEFERYGGSYDGSAGEIERLMSSGALYASAPPEQPDALQQIEPWQLVYALQNHDQVGNDPQGRRLWQLVGLERYKAAYALLLLAPCTPLLFMGDEFAASTPFLYFSNLRSSLVESAQAGRVQEFRKFWAEGPRPQTEADPQAEETFLRSRLDHSEQTRPPHDGVRRLFAELLRLRRDDPVLRQQSREPLRAWAVGEKTTAVERWEEGGARRLLVVNLGDAPALLETDRAWRAVLSTAEERFGGPGADLDALSAGSGPIEVPGQSAVLWS